MEKKNKKPLYSLVITHRNKNNAQHVVAEGQLEDVYRVTTQYKDKRDLVIEMGKKIGEALDPKYQDIEVKIVYAKNKAIKTPIFYSEDRKVLLREEINNSFYSHTTSPEFAREFALRYAKSRYFSGAAHDIINCVDSHEDYSGPLYELFSMIRKSYKSLAGLYLFIKKYDREQGNIKEKIEPETKKPTIEGLKEVKTRLNTVADMPKYKQLRFFTVFAQLELMRPETKKDRLDVLMDEVKKGDVDMDLVYGQYDLEDLEQGGYTPDQVKRK